MALAPALGLRGRLRVGGLAALTFLRGAAPSGTVTLTRTFDGAVGAPADHPTLAALLVLLDEAVAEGYGDKVLIYTPAGNWTYREIQAEANRVARVLQDDLKMATGERVLADGRKVHLALSPNPSHLEAVDPVVEGMVRATQDEWQGRGLGGVLLTRLVRMRRATTCAR